MDRQQRGGGRVTTVASARQTTNQAAYFEWIADILTMERPTDLHSEQVLAKAALKRPASWDGFTRFVAYVGSRWGTFGTKIKPSQITMAEEVGSNPRTVARWLVAAEELGYLRTKKPATPVTPAVYEIQLASERTSPAAAVTYAAQSDPSPSTTGTAGAWGGSNTEPPW
jgi:hypothetical protein